jgi:hypothetical protein
MTCLRVLYPDLVQGYLSRLRAGNTNGASDVWAIMTQEQRDQADESQRVYLREREARRYSRHTSPAPDLFWTLQPHAPDDEARAAMSDIHSFSEEITELIRRVQSNRYRLSDLTEDSND